MLLVGQQIEALTALNESISGYIERAKSGKKVLLNNHIMYEISSLKNIKKVGRNLDEDINEEISGLSNQIDWSKVAKSADKEKVVDSFADTVAQGSDTAKENPDDAKALAKAQAQSQIMQANVDNKQSTASDEIDKYMKNKQEKIEEKVKRVRESMTDESIDDDDLLDEDFEKIPEEVDMGNEDDTNFEDDDILEDNEELSYNDIYGDEQEEENSPDRKEYVMSLYKNGFSKEEIANSLCEDFNYSLSEAEQIINNVLTDEVINELDDEYYDDFGEELSGNSINESYKKIDESVDAEIENAIDDFQSSNVPYSEKALYESVCISVKKEPLKENFTAEGYLDNILKLSEDIKREKILNEFSQNSSSKILSIIGKDKIDNWDKKNSILNENKKDKISETIKAAATSLSEIPIETTLSCFKNKLFESLCSDEKTKDYINNSEDSKFFQELFNKK